MQPMVEINNLSKRFGPFAAVDDLTFSVNRGEVLGFLGPNGAGKSTTMKMIAGFLAPSGGTVRIGGDDVARKPVAVKKRMGYLPEGAPAYPDMTPATFLDTVAEIRGLRGAEKTRRVADTIDKINLGTVVNQTIETLSKGFKRRVGLAQAIVHDPEVLLLDEPTDGLDPNQKYEVRALIRAMSADKVIVLSTHILEEVHAVCTRAIIIADGRLVADGTPTELEARAPEHNAVELTVRDVKTDAVRKALEALPAAARVDVLENGAQVKRFRVYPADGAALVDAVGHLAHEQQWEVDQLRALSGRLDDVFRDITRGDRTLS